MVEKQSMWSHGRTAHRAVSQTVETQAAAIWQGAAGLSQGLHHVPRFFFTFHILPVCHGYAIVVAVSYVFHRFMFLPDPEKSETSCSNVNKHRELLPLFSGFHRKWLKHCSTNFVISYSWSNITLFCLLKVSYLLPAALRSEQMLHHLAFQENFHLQVALASCIELDTQLESSLLVDK